MEAIRPFRTWRFLRDDSEWPKRLLELTRPEKGEEDRSQFVRFARLASRLAEFKREGILVLSQEAEVINFEDTIGHVTVGLAQVDDVSVSQSTNPHDFQETLRIVEATNSWLRPQSVVLYGGKLVAVGDQTVAYAAKEFANGSRNPARQMFPVAIIDPIGGRLAFRSRCILSERISFEALRLRLSEHFCIQPVPVNRPMENRELTGKRFEIIDPEGSNFEATSLGLDSVGAINSDAAAVDPASWMESWVIQNLLGLKGSDFTTARGSIPLDHAIQLIPQSLSLAEFMESVNKGLLAREAVDLDTPVVPQAAIWSLSDYKA